MSVTEVKNEFMVVWLHLGQNDESEDSVRLICDATSRWSCRSVVSRTQMQVQVQMRKDLDEVYGHIEQMR